MTGERVCVLCSSGDVHRGQLCQSCIDARKRKKNDHCMGKCGARLLEWFAYCGKCRPTPTPVADTSMDFDPIDDAGLDFAPA